ncbi:Tat pathway signal sequence domain protein, partial [Streptomyces marokkonensis]|uniref:Tat pathway signal sequence domain protein n=1 Tax=Streptomyces marokkonensis TaxID=324855 RepID=UPI0031F03650
MSGTGPVEPGEGTRAWDTPHATPPRARPRGRPAGYYARHRPTVLTAAAALVVLAGGGYLYADRPQKPPTPPPPPASQAVDLDYLDAVPGPGGAGPGSFSFAVRLSVRSGPHVTVTGLTQPYDGLSMTSSPAAPFQTKTHSARKIILTVRVTECDKTPRNP